LNPNFPEANSWWDPTTGVNLFLDSPFSQDLSEISEARREAIYKGIETGLLIVAEGVLPEGFDRSKIHRIAPGRVRVATAKFNPDTHPKELASQQKLVAALQLAVDYHKAATSVS